MQRMSRKQRILLMYLLMKSQEPRVIKKIVRNYGSGIGKHGNDMHTTAFSSTTYTDAEAVAAVEAEPTLNLTGVIPDSAYPNAVLKDGSRAMTGNLNVAGNDIRTNNLALYELTSTVWAVTNLAHLSYRDIQCSQFRCNGALPLALQLKLYTKNRTDSDILLQCYDTAYRDVIRLINGQIRMAYLPVADPADGNNALWVSVGGGAGGENLLCVGT